jgi:hypothetical protein
MNHHHELGNQHRALLNQLKLAKQFKEKKRKQLDFNFKMRSD